MDSVFTARAFCSQAAAAHVLASKVLNAPEDLNAGAMVQSVAAMVQSAAAMVQSAAVPDQNVEAPARTVVAVDLIAAEDHDAVVVQIVVVVLRVAPVLSAEPVAHNCAQVDPVGVLECPLSHFARGAPHAVGRPALHAAQDVPDVRFFPFDLVFRSWPDALTALQFPRPAI